MPERRVKRINRPAIYGRPQPVRSRRSKPEVKLNWRAISAVLGLIVVVIAWWHWFGIKSVVVKGDQAYSPSLVQTAVQTELKSHWWWHNLMLLDTSQLQKDLLAKQPQLAAVAISRNWPSGLTLKVNEQNPNLTWQTGGQRYLLSQDGVVVAQAGQSNLKLPVVVDTTNLPVTVGQQVASSQFVNFCLDVIRLLPKQGLQVTGMQIPATTNEVYVSVNKGYYIKFDTTRDATSEVGDLVKVLNLLKSQKKAPSQYIDLRIPGAAYYQ